MSIKVTVGCCPSAKTVFILNQIRYLCVQAKVTATFCVTSDFPTLSPSPSHFSFLDFSTAGPSSDPCGASGGAGSALPCPFPRCLVSYWAMCRNRGVFPMHRVLQEDVGKGSAEVARSSNEVTLLSDEKSDETIMVLSMPWTTSSPEGFVLRTLKTIHASMAVTHE